MEEREETRNEGWRGFKSISVIIICLMIPMFLIHTDIIGWAFGGSKAQIRIEQDICSFLLLLIMISVIFFLVLLYRNYGSKGWAWGVVVLIAISLLYKPAIRGFYFNYNGNNRPYNQITYYDFYTDQQEWTGDLEDDYTELLFEFSLKEDDLEYWFETRCRELSTKYREINQKWREEHGKR